MSFEKVKYGLRTVTSARNDTQAVQSSEGRVSHMSHATLACVAQLTVGPAARENTRLQSERQNPYSNPVSNPPRHLYLFYAYLYRTKRHNTA